ncbi:MAG: fructosamine kinase family protein [Microcoleaceae cyanobacterium]
MWDQIAEQITQATGKKFEVKDRQSVGGGCINQGYRLSDHSINYFVKLNQASHVAMFEAEALGIQQMWNTQTIQVPRPICWGIAGSSAYIVMSWLEIGGRTGSQEMAEMGHKLALMHQWRAPKFYPGWHQFGWEINNTVGSTPQINTWTEHWADFWEEHRIGYQFRLAKRQGGSFEQAEELLRRIPELLANHQPQPSLVHGDLWGGNAAVTLTGEPVIFDPATYFGDREVDIAMTELFGGFSPEFYEGYNKVWPLEPGYKHRKILYNLYHILNHFNLFGGGYGSQANQMIRQLLH